MFSRQRKARVLFGLSDIILAALAFEAAYQTRVLLHLEHAFLPDRRAARRWCWRFRCLAWVTIGLWLEVYEKLDSGHPRVILRDAARQCAYGALCLVVFEYVLRLDLSRFFLALFAAYAWVLLLLFRLTAGRVVGVIRREFAAPHYVMVVGTGERAHPDGARRWSNRREYGVRLRGFLSETARRAGGDQLCASAYQVLPIADLPAILRAARDRRDHLRGGQREPGRTGRGLPAVRRRGRAHARGGGFLPARQQHGIAGPAWAPRRC